MTASDSNPDAQRSAAQGKCLLRPHWWAVMALCGVLLLFTPLDWLVETGLSGETVRPLLQKAIDKSSFWVGVVVVLAILLSFPNGRRVCVGFAAPLLLHLPVLHFLKWAIGRARPLAEKGSWYFEPFSGTPYTDAFPSGHSAMVAIVALTLGVYFPRARWVFYMWALLVGFERIVNNWHYVSDVVAGYALGGLIVHACLYMLGPKFYQTESPEP